MILPYSYAKASSEEAIEQILTSKPKIVYQSNENGSRFRRVKFGRAELDVDERARDRLATWTPPQLRHRAEEIVVAALLRELTGDWYLESKLKLEVHARWPQEIARAVKRVERTAAHAALHNLTDAVKFTIGMPLTLIPKDKVLARVGEAYDWLVVNSVNES